MQLALAPDGNGGIYRALKVNGILDDMEKRGVEHVHVYGVDNCLVKVANPTFIGYCVLEGAVAGAKVVGKSSPSEKVGVIAIRDGKTQVVEYSEIDEQTAAEKDPATGELKYNAGNIANHYFHVGFLREVAEKHEPNIPYHVAKKKIPHVDASGAEVKPDTPNGIKLELFVFDVFSFASKFACLEVRREDEFAPLKNATGPDSPETSRQNLSALHRRYIEAAGGTVTGGMLLPQAGNMQLTPIADGLVEISPLVSYAGEGLEPLVKGKTFTTPLLLQ